MMKAYFYPKSLYTSILAFSEQFNNITVRVFDPISGRIVGVKEVPIDIAPKEKLASILSKSDVNDVDPQVDNYLPRISINMSGFTFDNARMKGKYEKRLLNIEYKEEETGLSRTAQVDVQPVPWNINFEVVAWTKYNIDAMQLFENIAVWFAPENHISIKERNFGIERKSKVTLNSITPNIVFELGEKERRVIQHNYSFTMETVLYKPLDINPEILCTIVKIANVPCQKIPFEGDAIIVNEYATDDMVSSEIKSVVRQLDATEEYDLMVRHWQSANNTMTNTDTGTTFSDCVDGNCEEIPPPIPVWSEESGIESSCDERTQPTRVVRNIGEDGQNDSISTYHQEIVNTDNVLSIVSYRSTFDVTTLEILEQDVIIPNEEYPPGNDTNGDGDIDAE